MKKMLIIGITLISILTSIILFKSNEKKYISDDYLEDSEELLNESALSADSSLKDFLSYEGINAHSSERIVYKDGMLKLDNSIISNDTDEQDVFKTVKDIFSSLSLEEREVMENIASLDEDIQGLLNFAESKDYLEISSKMSNNKYTKLSSINQLGNSLIAAGLGYGSIIAIKGAFSAMLAAIKLFFVPNVIKIAVTVAAILVIATVIVINWDKVEVIFKSIVGMFVSAAGKIASAVSNVFDTIYNKAMDSVIAASRWIDGVKTNFKKLTVAAVITLTEKMRQDEYVLILEVGIGVPILASMKTYTKSQIMNKYKQGYSSYTPMSGDAKASIRDAFQGSMYTFEKHAKEGPGKKGLQFDHFHVFLNGVKMPLVHSLYGVPIWYG